MTQLTDESLGRALKSTERSPGWNNRPRDVRHFELRGPRGETCTLFVVPYRRWAYRRIERQAQARRESRAHA